MERSALDLGRKLAHAQRFLSNRVIVVLVRHEDNVAVNLVLACQRLHDLLVGDLSNEEARNDPGCTDTNVGSTVMF